MFWYCIGDAFVARLFVLSRCVESCGNAFLGDFACSVASFLITSVERMWVGIAALRYGSQNNPNC
jgi:hypothetical protein